VPSHELLHAGTRRSASADALTIKSFTL
jgi:hypothetical protein